MNTTDTTSFDYEQLGLDSRDMRVYESLYKLQAASLRKIAQETGLNRGTVYETVKHLTELGLVSFTQIGERRHFTAAEPEAISTLIQERRDQLLQLSNGATSYIRSLKQSQGAVESSYFARFYEGNEGIAAILRDVLRVTVGLDPREYCVVSSKAVSTFIYTNFASFSRLRIQQGVYARVLADSPAKKVALSERRRLASGGYALSGYMLLYGDKTALISLDPTNALSGIIIEDRGITEMHRAIFENLWQQDSTHAA